ncbi:MAG: hypothetical protein WC759_01120 [Candidatus Micrarchaeia archaeon]|jgi:hypothetical protein
MAGVNATGNITTAARGRITGIGPTAAKDIAIVMKGRELAEGPSLAAQRAEMKVRKVVSRQPVGTLILIEGRKTIVGSKAISARINAENAAKDSIRKHLPKLQEAAAKKVKETLRRTPYDKRTRESDWNGRFTGLSLSYQKGIIDVVVGREDCATNAGFVAVDGARMTPKRFNAYVAEIVTAALNHVSWTA